jgi:hypothetical protein
MTGSNRRPPPCRGGALPAELIALGTLCYAVFMPAHTAGAALKCNIHATLLAENALHRGGHRSAWHGPKLVR